jgi:putative acetyltransferase
VAFEIAVDDPRAADARALLERRLTYAYEHTRPEGVFALDFDGLLDPAVTFFSVRRDGELLGMGAIKQLTPDHAELKSMHTAEAARRSGVGRAMVEHLLGVARARGYHRVSLETGSQDAFAPARSLYEAAGFVSCGPFAEYPDNATSTFMTMTLDA